MRRALAIGLLLALPFPVFAQEKITWEKWSPNVFEQAKREHKFVLLDLHAVWCHWCHVMDEQTYANPKVIALLRARYLCVGVDADSRPDLANRYEDYGWPATIVFNAEGGEIVKRRGFIPPGTMASMLQAIIDDPTPGPSVQPEQKISVGDEAFFTEAARGQMLKRFRDAYDEKLGGWGTVHKFLDWDSVEYCLARARTGDADAARMAKQTLRAGRQLIDPVWGGVYQYSAEGDWKHPHFEKIMQMQAENMRICALAYAHWHDPADLKTGNAIFDFVNRFLQSPDGAFFTSQDADVTPGEHAGAYFKLDDRHRRAIGVPRVDQHVYARENGWFITALTQLFAVTGDQKFLDSAERAAHWILKNRELPGGGLRHGGKDEGGPFLGDTLAMGRACLGLYAVTGGREWLQRAGDAASFIAAHFKSDAGFATADVSISFPKPKPEFDENVMLARFANLLFHYLHRETDRELAKHAMRYLATPAVDQSRGAFVGGALLADSEMAREPLHLTVSGRKDDAEAKKLFAVTLRQPDAFKVTEWLDAGEGPLPGSSIPYPALPRAVVFVCTASACSPPIADAKELAAKLASRDKGEVR